MFGEKKNGKPKKSLKEFFWPKIIDLKSAGDTAKYGAFVIWWKALWMGIFGLIAIWNGNSPVLASSEIQDNTDFYLSVFVYSVLLVTYIYLGFMCYRASRISAIIILIIVISGIWNSFLIMPGKNIVLFIIFLLLAINGIRGSFAFHRYRVTRPFGTE